MESDDYHLSTLLQAYGFQPTAELYLAAGVVLALFFLIALISSAETAVACLSQEELTKAEESDAKRDRTVVYLTDHLRLMRASCEIVYFLLIIAVTGLSFIALYSYGEVTASAYAVAFLSVCLLLGLFYGIVPKLLLGSHLRTARAMAPTLKSIIGLCSPFVNLTEIPVEHGEPEALHKNQVPLDGETPADMYEEKEMLDEIIHFYNKKVTEIMTPRTDLVAIDWRSSLNEVVRLIVESGYSRLPVYKNSEDNIRGALYVKDIIPKLHKDAEFEWQSLIREPFYVPESKKIYDLLNELRANKTHIAFVVDEFGCTSGIVTMEDIIEEIIGDISDEYDDDEHPFLSLPDGSYIFEGKTKLNDFFRETGVAASDFADYTEEAETLTGLALAIKGSLPHRGETIDCKEYRFRILEADARRVLKVKFSIVKPENGT